MRYERAVEIDATAEKVWSVLVDVKDWPSWTPSVRQVEPLDDSDVKVGSRFRVTQPMLKPSVWEITKLEPQRSFSWSTSVTGIVIDADHDIESDRPNGVTVTLRLTQRGPMVWLATLLAGSRTRRYVQAEANGLKQRSEAT
jgi:uncharacterized membrane protein